MKKARIFRVFVLGEKKDTLAVKIQRKYDNCEVYYFPRSYNVFDLLRFSPDVIFDQKNTIECHKW